ncbi:MAG: outer membrane beta-barrel protein [Bacteroidales bacterium]|nr:outer membrane beta-barrel protein [Bacteroidales bacterium]
MKRFTTLLVAILISGILIAQAEPINYGKVEIIEEDGVTTVNVGGLIEVDEGQDTTKIKIGKKGITIIEDEEGSPSVTWEDLEEIDEPEIDDEGDDKKKTKSKKFKGHWSGFEIGLNSYVNDDYLMDVSPDFMDLNTGKSWNYNINFLQHDLALVTQHLGLVTGLGFEFSNYHFDNGNVIMEENGVIVEVTAPVNTDKARLQTVYLTVPLLMEFQVPAGKKKFFVSGGVIGGVKVASKTKMIYFDNGDKKKDKVKDDFNISALRYGFTARIGFRSLKLFANYYPMALFEDGNGPVGGDNLYPFAVGLSLINF